MEIMQIQSLLSEVQLVVKKNREMLDRTEWNFNVFRLCGIDHYETWHSKILAEFLNPQGTHRMGDVFLRLLFEQLQIDFRTGPFTEVVTELSVGSERMDIVIRNRNPDWTVAIENKVYAREQKDQLKRYGTWLESLPGTSVLLYLTLDGKESITAEGVDYRRVSYAEDVLKWLSSCVAAAAERPFVRETLRQYRNHIRSLTGQNLEEETMEELVKILVEPQNFEAATEVRRHWEEARNAIADRLLREAVAVLSGQCEIDEEAGWDFHGKDMGISIRIQGTDAVLKIASESGAPYDQMYVGIPNEETVVQEKCYTAMYGAKENDPSWEKNEWWVWKYLPGQYRNWNDGRVLLNCLKDESFKRGLIDAIAEAMREIVDVVKTVE